MARGQKSGIGCGTVLLLLVIALGIGAWRLGYIDRALYMANVENTASPAASSHEAPTVPEGPEFYAYSQLNDEDRNRYRIVLDSFTTREPRTYPESTMEELTRIRDCVLCDHPELFYVNGVRQLTTTNSSSGIVTDVTIEGQYTYSEDETESLKRQIDAAVDECLAQVPQGADDYETAKFFYEYLAANTEYDHAAASSIGAGLPAQDGQARSPGQTIADVFCNRSAVCGGYASAYQYLMKQAGIPCTYIVGTANGGSHAWCLALLDGEYYYIDPTWGDPQFLTDGGVAENSGGTVNYDYLCVTTDDLRKTHVIDCAFDVPACTSMQDNYYVREGLMFEEADADRLGAIAAEALSQGANAQIRCATEDVYRTLLDDVVASGSLASYLYDNVYRYTSSDEFLTIAIFPA